MRRELGFAATAVAPAAIGGENMKHRTTNTLYDGPPAYVEVQRYHENIGMPKIHGASASEIVTEPDFSVKYADFIIVNCCVFVNRPSECVTSSSTPPKQIPYGIDVPELRSTSAIVGAPVYTTYRSLVAYLGTLRQHLGTYRQSWKIDITTDESLMGMAARISEDGRPTRFCP